MQIPGDNLILGRGNPFQLLVAFLLAMEFHVWIDEAILTVISGFVISSLRFFSVLM